jgi:thioredoxin-like negative regulator of GroEL
MIRPLASQEHDSVLATGLNVLVFRVAESPACQQFQPELEEFVRCHPECAVWTVEAMQQRDLADRHGLRALPSIVIYRDGLPARRFAGGISADNLGNEVDEVAAADMKQELNDWMVEMLQTGEAGSPFISSRRGGASGEAGQPESDQPESGQPEAGLPKSPSQLLKPAQSTFRGVQRSVQSTTGALRPAFSTSGDRPASGDHDLEAGRAAWYAGEDEAAIRHFTAVLTAEPTSLSALNGRGQVLADSGAGEAALSDLDRFLGNGPSPLAATYARSARALALAQVGRHDEADQEIASALDATPRNAWAHLRRARIHLLRGDRAGAAPFLRGALEADNPPLTRSQRSLAESLLRAS